MKHHFNFVTSIPPARQREIGNWTRITLLLLSGLLITVIISISKQLLQLRELQEEYNHVKNKAAGFTKTSEQHAQLKKEIAHYKKKLEKIAQIQASSTTPASYIKTITAALPSGTTLQSFMCTAKTIDLSLLCPDAAAATTIIEKLAQYPQFEHLKLSTLQPSTLSNKPGYLVTIQGGIKG